jgi:glycine C-acetyltransferase
MVSLQRLTTTLEEIRAAGLYKNERIITSPQGVEIRVKDGTEVLNFCANNYLGLADHAEVISAAHAALDEHGFGLASVRFICGTQDLHKELEQTISRFFGTDDTILYTSCFDANGGLFETLLGPEDAVISDALNHASIIDGIRLCKAQRHRYPNSDMVALEKALKETQGCRTRLIATDGAFSMDGTIARLDRIVELAERYDALVMVDDSHATGFMGPTGTSSHRHWAKPSVVGRVASPPDAGKSSSCCVSVHAHTCSQTPCHRHWWPHPSGYLKCSPAPRHCATGWRKTPVISETK